MLRTFFLILGLSLLAVEAHSQYRYVECRCSVDFKTPSGEVFPVSDYVYCPTSEEYNFTCTGDVVGWSLDTICENSKGEVSRSPNWTAPRYSKEIPGTLSCGL